MSLWPRTVALPHYRTHSATMKSAVLLLLCTFVVVLAVGTLPGVSGLETRDELSGSNLKASHKYANELILLFTPTIKSILTLSTNYTNYLCLSATVYDR